jgi:hypothetical protein
MTFKISDLGFQIGADPGSPSRAAANLKSEILNLKFPALRVHTPWHMDPAATKGKGRRTGDLNLITPEKRTAAAARGARNADSRQPGSRCSRRAARTRWTFMFVGAPLRVPGGTGSPLNPLAIF